jgi:glycerol-3-phosphate acyltransferase PlsY
MPIVLVMAVVGYFLGSIPFGYLLVRIFRGEDVRQSGSGNIGATNVSRKSPVLGALTLLLDALKGTCAVFLANEVFARTAPRNLDVSWFGALSLVALCAILGHMFPVWLRFRGGKGVATSVGAFVLLLPHATLGAFAIFMVVALISRYVSLASIAAVALFPVIVVLMDKFSVNWFSFGPILLTCFLIVAKHHENIRRLLAGTEPRFGKRDEK